MKRALYSTVLWGVTTLSGYTFAQATPSIDPWALMSMNATEARTFLSEKGFQCNTIRAYLPQTKEGVRHMSLLRCTIEIAGPQDCYVVELDVTEGPLRKHEVVSRRSACALK